MLGTQIVGAAIQNIVLHEYSCWWLPSWFISAKIWSHPIACRHQCWDASGQTTNWAEHNFTHQQTGFPQKSKNKQTNKQNPPIRGKRSLLPSTIMQAQVLSNLKPTEATVPTPPMRQTPKARETLLYLIVWGKEISSILS